MDRVLLIGDDLQFNRQLEMTLRKVGFEVESANNEFTYTEPLLSFNPDYIIVRGTTSRLNVLNVGKKLKENAKQNSGKVILIFPENVTLSGDDLFKIRSDIILNDPISTLRLVLYLVSISGHDMEIVREKLMKYAITDPQFRMNEQQLLRNAGVTLDSEIEFLSTVERMPLAGNGQGAAYVPSNKSDIEGDSGLLLFKDERKEGEGLKIFNEDAAEAEVVVAKAPLNAGDFQITQEAKDRIQEEIILTKAELSLRIDSYNRAISNVDQDLKTGLKKRQTKKEFNQLHKDLLNEHKTDKKAEEDLDSERIEFTKALFKKN